MSRPRKDTRTDLAAELRVLTAQPENLAHLGSLRSMVVEAEAGEYHDYKNRKYVCGKVASHGFLMTIGTPTARALAKRIAAGEFDEAADAEDQAMLDGYVREMAAGAKRR